MITDETQASNQASLCTYGFVSRREFVQGLTARILHMPIAEGIFASDILIHIHTSELGRSKRVSESNMTFWYD